MNVTPEYKFYLCMCAIFGPDRNIVKNWDTYEQVFVLLLEADPELGVKHLFQTIIQFFVNKYPDQQNYTATLCKKLYDNSIIEDQFFIGWHGRKIKLDRHTKLQDMGAGKTMRGLIQEFVDWLQSAEYDEEDYGDEQPAEQEETKQPEKVETDAERQQRELIEAQKKA